ncbi:M24 family metallopeptidase [Homoserinimonas sp. A447]
MNEMNPEQTFRWDKTYAFMDEHGLDGLVVFGADRSDRYDAGQWFGRDRRYQQFVIPREGTPTMLAFAPQVAAQNMLSVERGLETWVQDIRVGKLVPGIVSLIKEKNLDNKRLGTIGTGYGSAFYPAGWVPNITWNAITKELPNVDFQDFTAAFGMLIAQKSEQDIEHIARAASAGDGAIDAMMRIAAPGVSEADLYAEGAYSMMRAGMRVTWMLFQTGAENYSWGEPTWLTRPEQARHLTDADQVWGELFPNYAELNTHVNMSFTVGKVAEETRLCGEIAEASYRLGVENVRVGRTLAEVAQAMEEPLNEFNAWHITPHIASLNPLLAGGDSGVAIDQHLPGFAKRFGTLNPERMGMDFEIKEGMTFSLQPDARLGTRGAIVGGVVVATKDGCVELNKVSPKFNHVEL